MADAITTETDTMTDDIQALNGDDEVPAPKQNAKTKANRQKAQAEANRQFRADLTWMADDERGRRLLADMIRPLLRAGFPEGRREYAQQVYHSLCDAAPVRAKMVLGLLVDEVTI